MKVLTFSTLYPNAERPHYGLFVETRLQHLVASGQVEARVVAPVPWFPSTDRRFGEYAVHARVPGEEQRNGIPVLHPRYLVVPRVGMTVAPWLLARGAGASLEKVLRRFSFDLIDAHYFYPDGVAAVALGRRLGKPVVITARGTDLNLISRYALPREMIRWAAARAHGLVTVSRALRDRLVELGVQAERVQVLRNGVDLERFRPVDRASVRRELGYARRTLLSVGNLVPLKGHDLVIRSLRLLPETDLVVVGGGSERAALESLVLGEGMRGRVRFAGALGQAELRRHYCAADALVLASSREGWPNVLLESMACGTPVAATNVGGTPEVVTMPEAGVLMAGRTPEALADAVRQLFANYPDHAATRRYAERFSWDDTTRGQIELFRRILAAAPRTQAEAA